jgi:hypothetical protein
MGGFGYANYGVGALNDGTARRAWKGIAGEYGSLQDPYDSANNAAREYRRKQPRNASDAPLRPSNPGKLSVSGMWGGCRAISDRPKDCGGGPLPGFGAHRDLSMLSRSSARPGRGSMEGSPVRASTRLRSSPLAAIRKHLRPISRRPAGRLQGRAGAWQGRAVKGSGCRAIVAAPYPPRQAPGALASPRTLPPRRGPPAETRGREITCGARASRGCRPHRGLARLGILDIAAVAMGGVGGPRPRAKAGRRDAASSPWD